MPLSDDKKRYSFKEYKWLTQRYFLSLKNDNCWLSKYINKSKLSYSEFMQTLEKYLIEYKKVEIAEEESDCPEYIKYMYGGYSINYVIFCTELCMVLNLHIDELIFLYNIYKDYKVQPSKRSNCPLSPISDHEVKKFLNSDDWTIS